MGRIGHSFMSFGFILASITLTLQAVQPIRSIAFGTSEIIDLSNQYRLNAGLPALITNQTLVLSADAKASHMASNSYFAHDAPDGTSPWFFFSQAGYAYSTAGENLALTNQSARSVVDGWYNSPGHRANMMSSEFTEVGYGISYLSSFTYNGVTYANVYLVAAHYGTPIYNANPTPSDQPAADAPTPQTVEQITSTEATPSSNPNPAQSTESSPTTPPRLEQSSNAAPTGFNAEPENTERSGALDVAVEQPPTIQRSTTLAGLGGGGIFVAVGGGIEIRRLLKHQPLLPGLHKK